MIRTKTTNTFKLNDTKEIVKTTSTERIEEDIEIEYLDSNKDKITYKKTVTPRQDNPMENTVEESIIEYDENGDIISNIEKQNNCIIHRVVHNKNKVHFESFQDNNLTVEAFLEYNEDGTKKCYKEISLLSEEGVPREYIIEEKYEYNGDYITVKRYTDGQLVRINDYKKYNIEIPENINRLLFVPGDEYEYQKSYTIDGQLTISKIFSTIFSTEKYDICGIFADKYKWYDVFLDPNKVSADEVTIDDDTFATKDFIIRTVQLDHDGKSIYCSYNLPTFISDKCYINSELIKNIKEDIDTSIEEIFDTCNVSIKIIDNETKNELFFYSTSADDDNPFCIYNFNYTFKHDGYSYEYTDSKSSSDVDNLISIIKSDNITENGILIRSDGNSMISHYNDIKSKVYTEAEFTATEGELKPCFEEEKKKFFETCSYMVRDAVAYMLSIYDSNSVHYDRLVGIYNNLL